MWDKVYDFSCLGVFEGEKPNRREDKKILIKIYCIDYFIIKIYNKFLKDDIFSSFPFNS